jgi:hypothetical protein
MNASLYLFAMMALLGAFDTIYFHEWKARLPLLRDAEVELTLHASRDFIYGILFVSLLLIAGQGSFAIVLVGLLLAELAITSADFVIEDRVRKVLGGVYPGERVTHAVMGLVYGAALAAAAPVILKWWRMPTGITVEASSIPSGLRYVMIIMAFGVSASGLCDLYAAVRFGQSAAA